MKPESYQKCIEQELQKISVKQEGKEMSAVAERSGMILDQMGMCHPFIPWLGESGVVNWHLVWEILRADMMLFAVSYRSTEIQKMP